MPAAIPMAVAGAVVSAQLRGQQPNFLNGSYGMPKDQKPPTAKECNGCGAPLKYTRHCCEYCGRNP